VSEILGDRYYWYSRKMHEFLRQQMEIPRFDDDWPWPSEIYLFPDGRVATLSTMGERHDCGWDDMHLVCKARLMSAKRVKATTVEVQS